MNYRDALEEMIYLSLIEGRQQQRHFKENVIARVRARGGVTQPEDITEALRLYAAQVKSYTLVQHYNKHFEKPEIRFFGSELEKEIEQSVKRFVEWVFSREDFT